MNYLLKETRDGLVYARVVLPKNGIKKFPVIFHFHGYMGRCWDWADMLAYTVAGWVVLWSMGVRGQSGYSTDGDCSLLGNTSEKTDYPWSRGRSG